MNGIPSSMQAGAHIDGSGADLMQGRRRRRRRRRQKRKRQQRRAEARAKIAFLESRGIPVPEALRRQAMTKKKKRRVKRRRRRQRRRQRRLRTWRGFKRAATLGIGSRTRRRRRRMARHQAQTARRRQRAAEAQLATAQAEAQTAEIESASLVPESDYLAEQGYEDADLGGGGAPAGGLPPWVLPVAGVATIGTAAYFLTQ